MWNDWLVVMCREIIISSWMLMWDRPVLQGKIHPLSLPLLSQIISPFSISISPHRPRHTVSIALGYSKAIVVDLGFCLQVMPSLSLYARMSLSDVNK
jgi:hypothetical protein